MERGRQAAARPTRPPPPRAAPQPLFTVPGDLALTSVDAADHPLAGALAAGADDVTALALWLAAERGGSGGPAAKWAPLLATLPATVDTPVLWDDDERAVLLRGSPVLAEARARDAALDAAHAALVEAAGGAAPSWLSRQAFRDAVAVVTATAAYLPAAGCFALLPVLSRARRSGAADAARLDYDEARGAAVLTAARAYAPGDPVDLADGRPNGELLLATGAVDAAGEADCLAVAVGLAATDRMRTTKLQILEAVGLVDGQSFPIKRGGFPLQLLSYLRLARLQDPAQLAAVTFDKDVVVSPSNEYEVLQLLLGECRERLSAYAGGAEEDTKLLQDASLTPRARAAAMLRLGEKRILQATLDAARRRLAPIRGVPTKDGTLRDANADFVEMFDAFEALPSVPKKVVDGLLSWARGEGDPEYRARWGKNKK